MKAKVSEDKKRSTAICSKEKELIEQFKSFILEGNHPCIMAQTVMSMNHYDFEVYEDLGSDKSARGLLRDLSNYLDKYDFESHDFYTFIALFKNETLLSEEEFEQKLWLQLQKIHNIDESPWDFMVSEDPEADNFSFSIAGTGFFIIGMHPNSSRKARQSPMVSVVFNLHNQFEKLREMGVYHRVRDKIRKRDKRLQGLINPMVEDFGEASEARQYSGRAVGEAWKCPFHKKN